MILSVLHIYTYIDAACRSWKFGIENWNTLSKIIHLISVTKWTASQMSEVTSKNVVIVLLHVETRGHQGLFFLLHVIRLQCTFQVFLKLLKYTDCTMYIKTRYPLFEFMSLDSENVVHNSTREHKNSTEQTPLSIEAPPGKINLHVMLC